jgi:hypothetical protein
LAAGVGLAAMGVAGKRALDYASSLGEVSQQLGVTTRDLQEYRFAATQVGIEQDAMDKSLAKLTRTIGEAANGGKQQQRVFKALGIDIRNASGNIKTAGELIPEVAAALEGVQNPAQRAAVLVQLFGKSGQQLETLLAGGRGQVDGLRDSAQRLGIVLSDKQIQSADDTADKLAAIKQVLEARIAGVVADNAQAILTMADSFGSLAGKIAEFWQQDPTRAFGLMGMAAGASIGSKRGGWIGAAAGGTIGYIAGTAMAPETPGSLRAQGENFRKRAQEAGRAYGYYRDGVTEEERKRLRERVFPIKHNLALAKKFFAQADEMQRSLSLGAPKGRGSAGGGSIDLDDINGGGGGGGAARTRTNEQAFRDFQRELAQRGIQPAAGRSGFRTAADQNEIYRTQPGATPLDGYRKVSRHQAWQAFDPTRASHDEEAAYAAAREAGLKGFRVVKESGGRRHYEWSGHGGKGDISDALAEQEQAEQAAARAAAERREEQERIVEAMGRETEVAAQGLRYDLMRIDGREREADLAEKIAALWSGSAENLAKLPEEQQKLTEGMDGALVLLQEQADAYAGLLLAHGDRATLTEAQRAAEAQVVDQMQAELNAALALAKTEGDRVLIRDALLRVSHKLNNAAEDGAAAAARQKKEDEEAQQRYLQMLEERRDAQEQQFQELADFWEQAFRSGGKSVWEDFKDEGYRVLGQLAAQWTMQLLSGQKISLPGALEQLGAVSGAGRGGFDILSLFGMGGGGGISGAAGRAPGGGFGGGNPATRMAELEKVVGGLQDPGTAAGGIGGAMGSIGQAVPYMAAAMAATSMISDVLGIKNHARGMFGILGNLAINAITPAKRGSATLGFDQYGQLGVSSSRGNSSKRVDAAKDAIGSVSDTLERIAEALGGSLTGSVTASIGMRDGNWRVDPTGRGITKTKNGAMDFGKDAEAAARYLVGEALRDGVVAGISDASKRILASGQDLERAIEKAALIESIPDRLAAYLDPVGAQLDELNERWEKTIAALREGGASAEEMAKAQQLYKLELQETKAAAGEASADLKAFLNSMAFGQASPYSYRDQEAKAAAALKPFLDQIDAKEAIDQKKFIEAAEQYLAIERQIGGSTSEFFDPQKMIEDYTSRAIAQIDSAKPIRTYADPFAEKTASNTDSIAYNSSEMTVRLAAIEGLLGRIVSGGGGGGGGFVGGARGFVRTDSALP